MNERAERNERAGGNKRNQRAEKKEREEREEKEGSKFLYIFFLIHMHTPLGNAAKGCHEEEHHNGSRTSINYEVQQQLQGNQVKRIKMSSALLTARFEVSCCASQIPVPNAIF